MWKLCRIYQYSILGTLAPIVWSSWITHMFNWNHNRSLYLLQRGCCNILPVHYQSSYGTLVFVVLCFDVLKNSDLFVVSWCSGISPLLLPYPLHRPRLQIACALVFIFQWVVILDFMVLLSFGGMSIVRNVCFPSEKLNSLSGFYHMSYLHLRITNSDVKLWFHTWHLQTLPFSMEVILERPLKYTYSYKGLK